MQSQTRLSWCSKLPIRINGRTKTMTNHGGVLLAIVPENEVLCATCEGRAIGAGQTESRLINGHMVKYAPRI